MIPGADSLKAPSLSQLGLPLARGRQPTAPARLPSRSSLAGGGGAVPAQVTDWPAPGLTAGRFNGSSGGRDAGVGLGQYGIHNWHQHCGNKLESNVTASGLQVPGPVNPGDPPGPGPDA